MEKTKRRKLSLEDYYQGIVKGDRAILARALTLIESTRVDQQEQAQQLLTRVLPLTGRSFRLGISGVPGAGKSTFIECFGKMLIRKGYKIAVLAIDPSSEKTGGSLLGDKTRMRELAADDNAFIRPSPTAGRMGGVAHKTQEAMLLCEAANYDIIIVETVGVGQSETLVASMVDFFLMLSIPGAGDELQGIKRGILEVIDLLVVNKADGDRKWRALRARSEYEMALHILHSSELWFPSVLTCSALFGEGLEEVWDKMLVYRERMESNGHFAEKRKKQMLSWMWRLIEDRLMYDLRHGEELRPCVTQVEANVLENKSLPFEAAHTILQEFFKSKI